MGSTTPKFTVTGSAIAEIKDTKVKEILQGKDVYVKKQLSKEVPAHTKFLYCEFKILIVITIIVNVHDVTKIRCTIKGHNCNGILEIVQGH